MSWHYLQEREEAFWAGNCLDGAPESRLGRVANGVANRVDRLKAIGNGQVPAVVKLAWNVLTDRINDGQ
jgi:hypothetical protein